MPIEACPKCSSSQSVYGKLITCDIGRQYFCGDSYYVADTAKFFGSQYVEGDFINALFCSDCEVGFVPDYLLGELGIRESGQPCSHFPSREFGSIGHLDDRKTRLFHGVIWGGERSGTNVSIKAKSASEAKSELEKIYPRSQMTVYSKRDSERKR